MLWMASVILASSVADISSLSGKSFIKMLPVSESKLTVAMKRFPCRRMSSVSFNFGFLLKDERSIRGFFFHFYSLS
ncbi:hypothetical protein BpHYR1_049842 [Brachionus plicatilis]|uniref:Secreted protein n=1 Tax=Brachionus plicatilis TaxID=10195 RepID=A0A3M7P411_BRAPC|nr:hypothetical protein BpHYR1_049842 [Brachionus plicatilis]